MKNLIALFISLFTFISPLQSQTTESFTHNGVLREYILYVPASYDGTTPFPLVISLHGLGDDMNNFSMAGFHLIADYENFIVVTPQALVDPLSNATAWNSNAGAGGITLNPNVDDVGFISDLIDTISTQYSVNADRVYATGFSMGGFMTNRLACELNTKIAAFASVAGTIGNSQNCNPGRPVAFCHLHGTADPTVPYINNQFGLDAQPTVDFWVNNNSCDLIPDSTNLPDTIADGIDVVHYLYENGNLGTEVELYKANGAGHIWMYPPMNDIFYPLEIWKFFSKHQMPGTVSVTELNDSDFKVYPNPSNGPFNLMLPSGNWKVEMYDMQGKLWLREDASNRLEINVSVPSGMYTLNISNQDFSIRKKCLISH